MAMARERKEYKVIIKLTHDGASVGEWNPIQLTKIINRMLGEIKSAKVLRNASLLEVCRDSAQQGKAIRLNRIDGKRVECSLLESKKYVWGVISGIPTAITEQQIKENVVGAKVIEVTRLRKTRNGEKCDSLSVMIKLDEMKVLDMHEYSLDTSAMK